MAKTIRAQASGAARMLRDLLAEKTLPASLRQQVENLVAQMRKTWSDLEQDADADPERKEAASLAEAANLGDWLESRIHSIFTQLADDLFGEGRLTREERILCSGAIGDALNAFNARLMADGAHLYQRNPWSDAPLPMAFEGAETLTVEASAEMPLLEKAVRADGTIPIKIIQPGWGSSGYYPAAVLERDGPQIFATGVKMFWNHQTPEEERQRPEGDLNALAAELVSPARWIANGPKGAGLYADAKVFENYRGAVDDLAQHIGVSIRASGKARMGQAEGKSGPIIEQLLSARSVDFVTMPGAGGQIVQMFEAARRGGAPVSPAPTSSSVETGGNPMLTEAEIMALQADNDRLTRENAALKNTQEAAVLEAARLREAKLCSDAQALVTSTLAKIELPAATRTRLTESLVKQANANGEGALDVETFAQTIQEAAKAELAYLAEAAGVGKIQGMGSLPGAGSHAPTDATHQLTEAFRAMGLSDKAAEAAAKGR